jgi:Holliday junction resolvase
MRMSRCRLTREIYMTRALMKAFPDTAMVFDKAIQGGCSKRRPDVLMDLLTHVLIVECDEKQHKPKSYIAQCERRRKMELFRDVGSRPVVFVRFNPDGYNGVGGCFRDDVDKNGERVLTVLPEWRVRVKELVRVVGEHMVNIPNREVTETRLFFDS